MLTDVSDYNKPGEKRIHLKLELTNMVGYIEEVQEAAASMNSAARVRERQEFREVGLLRYSN